MLKKIFCVLLTLWPMLASADSQLAPYSPIWHEKGLILEVQNHELPSGGRKQDLRVKIVAGLNQNRIIETTNFWNGGQREVLVQPGDKVLVYAETNSQGEIDYSIRDFWRFDGMIFWLLAFFGATWLVARGRGLKGILALALSILLIFWLFLPRIVAGSDPLLCTLLVSIFIILVNVPLIHGLSRKSLSISLATTGAIIITIGITLLLDHFLKIKGTGAEETIYLQGGIASWQSLPRIFAAGVTLGALGAVMDVCVSIASGLWEITQHGTAPFAKLFRSGMNIGGDILGSMLNTLVFAYVGSSLIMLLVLAQGDIALMPLLNFSFIIEEIIRSLIGAFGLLVAIPLTALISGLFLQNNARSS